LKSASLDENQKRKRIKEWFPFNQNQNLALSTQRTLREEKLLRGFNDLLDAGVKKFCLPFHDVSAIGNFF